MCLHFFVVVVIMLMAQQTTKTIYRQTLQLAAHWSTNLKFIAGNLVKFKLISEWYSLLPILLLISGWNLRYINNGTHSILVHILSAVKSVSNLNCHLYWLNLWVIIILLIPKLPSVNVLHTTAFFLYISADVTNICMLTFMIQWLCNFEENARSPLNYS